MIIIPARIDSTRFPKKVLAEIDGVPMVIKTALNASRVDETVIATDSPQILSIAKDYSIKAVLTSKSHSSGTERINEAAAKMGLGPKDVVINVQADEPFLEIEVIKKVRELTLENRLEESVLMNSAYKIVPADSAQNPDIVKVTTDSVDMALYFSRSLIPYPRQECKNYKVHLGIYGYTYRALQIYCSLKPSPLESYEKLEQLRVLYHGYKVALCRVESDSIGIDTIEDLKEALKKFRS